MIQLELSPYSLSEQASEAVIARLKSIEDRVSLLRSQGTLTQSTLFEYYGQKRFEQVAESNAIEGSTLSVGETELAVLKGVTITGHDPAYIRDAVALDGALSRVTDIAKTVSTPTTTTHLLEVHGLLLGERSGAGMFRDQRVTIRGSKHTPPKTRQQVIAAMEKWDEWSIANREAPAPLRAAILHAWITHVHPFIDGNGRVSRAIGNLELIRAGYPSIIIKKKERERYLDALAESDEAGDIQSFVDLILDRADAALTGLELSARKAQGYDPLLVRLQLAQQQQVVIWCTAVKLLATIVENQISNRISGIGGGCIVKSYEENLDLEDYIALCQGRPISGGWAFQVHVKVPGLERFSKLVYTQHRTARLYNNLAQQGGPSLFFSRSNPDPNGYPKWIRDGDASPFATEISLKAGSGDEWIAIVAGGAIMRLTTTQLAERLSQSILEQMSSQDGHPALPGT